MSSMDTNPIRILLVEDDSDDVALLSYHLSEVPSARYCLTVAQSFSEALQRASEDNFDVILLDLGLPDSWGFETFHGIQAIGPRVPIIVLTGLNDELFATRAVREGAQDYLVKGEVNGRLLLRTIRYAIERKQAAEALRASEEKMRIIIESSPIGIRINQHNRYVYVNPALVSMFGYEHAEEIIGLPLESLYVPEDRQLIRQRMNDKLEGRPVPLSYEARGLGKDGRRFDIAVWVTQIEYHGELATLAFINDISVEKALQAQLFRAQKMEAIGTLAGGIAHDFNNILGIIMGYTEIALFSQEKGSPVYEHFEQVRKASQRAVDLVKQILAFSRHSEQDRKPLHLIPIIKETLKLLRAVLPSTIEIRQNIKVSLGEDTVLADPTQIHQILMNLCTNAGHAMRERGGVLEVSLAGVIIDSDEVARSRDLKQGHYVRLTITDTGHGMDRSVMERIFEPYFSTKEIGEGTGLGLSVVHGIVKSYGGSITVSSEPEAGARFDIDFPRLVKEISLDDEVASMLPKGKETILLVDDEEGLVNAGRQMLEHLGYNVVAETNSVDALEAFRKEPESFDLVITDLTMPRMTGIELAEKLLDIHPNTPIIMCTGFSDLITPEKAKAMGIRDLIMKPLVLYNIAGVIRRVLDSKRVDDKKFGIS